MNSLKNKVYVSHAVKNALMDIVGDHLQNNAALKTVFIALIALDVFTVYQVSM
jgi:hypothetical protein